MYTPGIKTFTHLLFFKKKYIKQNILYILSPAESSARDCRSGYDLMQEENLTAAGGWRAWDSVQTDLRIELPYRVYILITSETGNNQGIAKVLDSSLPPPFFFFRLIFKI